MSRLALLLSSLHGVWFCLYCGKANSRFMGLHYTRLGLAESLQPGPNRALNKTVNNLERKGSTYWSSVRLSVAADPRYHLKSSKTALTISTHPSSRARRPPCCGEILFLRLSCGSGRRSARCCELHAPQPCSFSLSDIIGNMSSPKYTSPGRCVVALLL